MFLHLHVILFTEGGLFCLSLSYSEWVNVNIYIITTRQRSCGKVMFSPVSICSQGVTMWPLPMMHWTSLYRTMPPDCETSDHQPWDPHPPPRQTWDPPAINIWWPSLENCSNLFIRGSPPPPVLRSGGWSSYGWQAGGMHPTGMLSC